MPHALLRPALGILDPLTLSRKFGLIAGFFLLAAAVPAILLARLEDARLELAIRQVEGVRFFRPLAALGEHLSLHRLAPPAGAPGEGPDARRRLEGLLDEDLDRLGRIGGQMGGHPAAVAGLRQRVAGLLAAGDPALQAAAQEGCFRDLRDLEARVVDASRLMASDEPAALPVMDASTRKLPELEAQLVRLTLQARESLADQVADPGERAAFQRQSGAIQGLLASLQEGMASARPEVARRLKDAQEALGKATTDLLALVEARFQGGGPPAAIAFTGAEAVRNGFAFQGLALRALEDGLLDRIRDLRRNQRWTLAGSSLAFLLASYLLAGLYMGLGQGLQASAATLREAARNVMRESEALVPGIQGAAAGLGDAVERLTGILAAAAEAEGKVRRSEAGAERLHGLVTEGREAVALAARTLGDLAGETGPMVEAVREVEDLAFRARLAALDAASGESAGGFTALAARVHELGRRGARDSRRVLDLLQGTGTRLQAGASAATRAQGALEGIRTELVELDAALANLRGAAREQARDLEELRRVAGELEGLIRGNAARVGVILEEAGNGR